MIQIGKDIRIEASEYKGKFYISIRRWYEKDSEWLPSNKGISLKKEEWDELISKLDGVIADVNSTINA